MANLGETFTSGGANFQGSVCREKYWNELSSEEKIEKLAAALEMLSRWSCDNEKALNLLNQHVHGSDGRMLIPMQHNVLEVPWYKNHLINRETRETK